MSPTKGYLNQKASVGMKLGAVMGFMRSKAYTNVGEGVLFEKQNILLFSISKKKAFMKILLVSHSGPGPVQMRDREA